MTMSPRVRKLALAVHVTSSVGWLGAVAVFFVLALIGLMSSDEQTVRGAYLVMEPAARYILVPLSFAALITGVVQSLGTTWGLVRNYWVIFKLSITVVATLVLLSYTSAFRYLASVAGDPGVPLPMVRNASPAIHAGLAIGGLVIAVVLSVYKPRGLTGYGQRKQMENRRQRTRPVEAELSRS